MLNILVITSGLERCGIASYTENLIREMNKIDKIKIDCLRLKPDMSRFCVLKEIIRKKPDIVHVQHELMIFDRFCGLTALPIYLFTFLTKKKTVTTFHTVKSLTNFENEVAEGYSKNPILMLFAKNIIKFLFKMTNLLSNKIIVLTESAKNTLETDYKINNVVYIPHGFYDPIRVKGNEKELCKFKEEFGVKAKEKIILLFGFAFEFKGYHRVINSLPKLLKHTKVKLVITGGTADTDPLQCKNYLYKLREMVKELNLEQDVIFTDYMPDDTVPYLLTISDVAIFPYNVHHSASGSLSTVYPYKVPIIVSDIPAFDFLENGKDCIKVDANNEDELVEAINLILNNNCISTKLREYMTEKIFFYSIESVAKAHLSIYKNMLNKE